MKKTAYIIFLFVYVLLAVGMTISTHFCAGKIASVRMLPIVPKEAPCGCEDTEIPDDCCKTEIKSVQLNVEQIAVHSEQPSAPLTDVALWADVSWEAQDSSHVFRTIVPTSSPPESPRSYILHCTLLI